MLSIKFECDMFVYVFVVLPEVTWNGSYFRLFTQVAKRDETILSLQSELDATREEYETCSSELLEREQEVAELKGKLSKLEVELKGVKAERESGENKVRLLKGTTSLYMFIIIQ